MNINKKWGSTPLNVLNETISAMEIQERAPLSVGESGKASRKM